MNDALINAIGASSFTARDELDRAVADLRNTLRNVIDDAQAGLARLDSDDWNLRTAADSASNIGGRGQQVRDAARDVTAAFDKVRQLKSIAKAGADDLDIDGDSFAGAEVVELLNDQRLP